MSARAWTAFAAVSTLWGIPYLFIKVAVDDGVPPVFLAWARVLMAAIVLLALSHRAGVLKAAWQPQARKWLLLYAVIEICGPFPLIAAGERHVDSSLAAILIAAVPMLVALLALRFDPSERATGRRAIGLAIGFAGVVALVGLDVSGNSDELIGALAILLAAVGYAGGPMIINQRLRGLDPRALMAVALSIATVLLTPAALLAPPSHTPSTDALVSIVVLGLFCTAAAFVLFGALIAEIGPGRATVITYISPIVAVTLGVAVLDERPGAGAVAGLLLILAGSWLSTDGRLPPGLDRLVARARGRLNPAIPDRQADVADSPSPRSTPMKPLRPLLAVVLIPAALFLAACGSDDDNSSSSSTPAAASTTAAGHQLPEGQPLAGRERPADGRHRQARLPAVLRGRRPDQRQGLRERRRLRDRRASSGSRRPRSSGRSCRSTRPTRPGPKKFDFDVNQISITPARAKRVDFSEPVLHGAAGRRRARASSDAANATSLADLKDAKLGVQIGTTSLDAVDASDQAAAAAAGVQRLQRHRRAR